MQETRKLRLENLIHEELSLLISRQLKDPRVQNVTITRVELSPDGRYADVFITPFIFENHHQADTEGKLRGLTSAANFLRRNIAKNIHIKHIPHLRFKSDDGLENSIRIRQVIGDHQDDFTRTQQSSS